MILHLMKILFCLLMKLAANDCASNHLAALAVHVIFDHFGLHTSSQNGPCIMRGVLVHNIVIVFIKIVFVLRYLNLALLYIAIKLLLFISMGVILTHATVHGHLLLLVFFGSS